jgi:hypothetical protein
LTVSIPFLTVLLILPHAPSLPYLNLSLLPLSRLLVTTLVRSLRGITILMPLVLVLFAVFAWSMNGDIFRLLQDTSTIVLPTETEIAPFEARVWLIITITLLLFFALTLAASRSRHVGVDDRPRWQGGVEEEDDWERDFGVLIGRMARRDFAEAVRLYSGRSTSGAAGLDTERQTKLWPSGTRIRPVIVPFNLLVSPLRLALYITVDSTSMRRICKLYEWIEVMINGPFCVVLALLERPFRPRHDII